jgi:hypothetical protein
MRTNERTIGNTASHHVEEVQSDMHQKGREEGYRGAPTDKAVEEKASSGFDQAWRGGGKSWETVAEDERKIWRENTRARMIEKGDGVPDAPFKKTWPELTMKQALRDAVEGGKDRLSWTPGEAQAKRYDLSKQISDLELHGVGDNLRLSANDLNGRKIIDMQHVTPTTLADHIGKEAANKLLAMPEPKASNPYSARRMAGVDLKVGGEGMNEFYDKMLPKAVEKLGKAHGVKVQRGTDTTGNPVNYIDIPPAWKQEILKKGFSLFAAGGSVFDKMQEAKHMQEGGGLSSFLEGEYSGNKQGQHGWGYLGIESPTWSAGIGGQGWRANTPEGPLGRASITNVDVGHKKGDLNLKGSYSANQREIAGPSSGGNPYFDPIDYPGQKFSMPNDIDKRFMLRLSKPFSDGGSVLDKMHAAKHMAEGGGTDVPFNEWDAVPRNAEGESWSPPYEPAPPSVEGFGNSPEKPKTDWIDAANGLDDKAAYYAGPHLAAAGRKVGEIAKMILPGAGAVAAGDEGIEAGKKAGEGKYGQAAAHLGTGAAFGALDFIPPAKLMIPPAKLMLGMAFAGKHGASKLANALDQPNAPTRPNKRASAEDINRAADESAGMTQAELRALYNELGITGTPPSSLVKTALADQPKSAIDAATSMKLEDIAAMNKLSKKDRELFVKGKLPNFVLPSQEAAAPARIEFDKVRKEIKKLKPNLTYCGPLATSLDYLIYQVKL